VREYRRSAEELLSDLDRIEEHTLPGEADFYPNLTRLYGREWARAMVRWANATERAIQERV
jgi:hypothetical protein